MGDLDVMHISGSEEEIMGLPRYQEVLAVIVASEVQPVGTVGDQDLDLTFEVIRGPSAGRRIRQRIPLWSHDDPVRIKGRTHMRVLCRALGIEQPSDSSEFHGMPLLLRLRRRRGREERPMATFAACSEADRRAWEEASDESEDDRER